MTLDLAPRALPLLTAELPGTGGAAKVSPEDFMVEEIPAYVPSGTGEHLYLWIEKRNLSTNDAARVVADALGVSARDVGYAGQKDRQAVARQWISLLTPKAAPAIDDVRLRVLESRRHANKLRLGHTRGNRFTVVLRGTTPEAVGRARAILERLGGDGLPNFYGTQRFGRRADNAALGAALLGLGEHPEIRKAARTPFLRKLAISALQSELFNRCLAARMTDGLWHDVLRGDVLRKRASGGLFVSTNPEVDQPRLMAGEVDVTGPMPGERERPAVDGIARDREEAVLQAAGIPREAFQRARGEAEGARRSYRVAVSEAAVTELGENAIQLTFTLPSGSYATRVLAEVAKSSIDLPDEG